MRELISDTSFPTSALAGAPPEKDKHAQHTEGGQHRTEESFTHDAWNIGEEPERLGANRIPLACRQQRKCNNVEMKDVESNMH